MQKKHSGRRLQESAGQWLTLGKDADDGRGDKPLDERSLATARGCMQCTGGRALTWWPLMEMNTSSTQILPLRYAAPFGTISVTRSPSAAAAKPTPRAFLRRVGEVDDRGRGGFETWGQIHPVRVQPACSSGLALHSSTAATVVLSLGVAYKTRRSTEKPEWQQQTVHTAAVPAVSHIMMPDTPCRRLTLPRRVCRGARPFSSPCLAQIVLKTTERACLQVGQHPGTANL